MIVKLLTEHHLEFLSLKEAAEARPSLHMSKCHIVGNLMHWLNYYFNYNNKIQHFTNLLFFTVYGRQPTKSNSENRFRFVGRSPC